VSERWELHGSMLDDAYTRQGQADTVAALLAGPWCGFDAYARRWKVVVDEPLSDGEVETLLSVAARSAMRLSVVAGRTRAVVYVPPEEGRA
jgi:hypothetical protein